MTTVFLVVGALLTFAVLPAAGKTANGTVQANAHTHTTAVTGTATVGGNRITSSTGTSYYLGSSMGISLTKYTNGLDVANPYGLYLRVGDLVTWTYRITNTGSVTLALVLTDTPEGSATAGCSLAAGTELAAGAATTCTLTGTVFANAYTNTATVTGTSTINGSLVATDTDTSYYFGSSVGIWLAKFTNGVDVARPSDLNLRAGDAVTWTYRITNTGNVTLTLDLVDVPGGSVPISGCLPAAGSGLAQSTVTTCTLTGTVQAGAYTNTATVTGTATVGGNWVTTGTDASYYFGRQAALTLSMSTQNETPLQPPGPLVKTGDPVTWQYLIQNTGNVTLTGLSLVDSVAGVVISCAPIPLGSGLAPTQFTTCTKVGIAGEGQYTNTAVITGTPVLGPAQPITQSARSYYFGVRAALVVSKLTNGVQAPAAPGVLVQVGSTVTWTYIITNTGNVALNGLAVTDSRQGDVTDCTPALASGLAPGQGMTCRKTGTAQSGQYSNTVAVSGQAASGPAQQVTAGDVSYYYGTQAALVVTKLTNGVLASAAPGVLVLVGSPVNWTYIITNTGNVALNALAVTDSRQGPVTDCTPALGSGLEIGQVMTCSKTGTAQAGQYSNTVVATGLAASGPAQQAAGNDTSYYYGMRAALVVTKLTNGVLAATAPGVLVKVGTPVNWTYIITNTGNVPLNQLAAVDNREGSIADCTPGLASGLAPGQALTCRKTSMAQPGQYSNTAAVTGQAVSGPAQQASARATSYYYGSDSALTATASPASVGLNEQVTFTLVITGGSSTLPYVLEVTDTLPSSFSLVMGSASASTGTVTLDRAKNSVYWSYVTMSGSTNVATVSYRATLLDACAGALSNRAKLYEGASGAPVDEASAPVGLVGDNLCRLYLGYVAKPDNPMPELVNGDFDLGSGTGWEQSPRTLIERSEPKRYQALSQPYFAWLGGILNQEHQLQQRVAANLPASYGTSLQFCYRIRSEETTCGSDWLEIRVNDVPTGERIDLCQGKVTPGTQWVRAERPLGNDNRGKPVTISFFSSLNGALISNFLVDNVKLCTSDPAAAGRAPLCAADIYCSPATAAAEQTEQPADGEPVEKPVAPGDPLEGG